LVGLLLCCSGFEGRDATGGVRAGKHESAPASLPVAQPTYQPFQKHDCDAMKIFLDKIG